MRFTEPLITGRLVRRYRRFLADVALDDPHAAAALGGADNGGPGVITAHCPNSGSMKTCLGPDWPVRLSDSRNPRRKLRLTWEMVHNGRCWIGINTMRPNRLAIEGISGGVVPELAGYSCLRREVPYGTGSRIDILLSSGSGAGTDHCYVEVKNVTLLDPEGRFAFPDAVTERGRKHLRELREVVAQGHRAVMLFVIQRSDGSVFTTADDIDPAYGEELRRSVADGVEVLAYHAEVTPEEITLRLPVPIDL